MNITDRYIKNLCKNKKVVYVGSSPPKEYANGDIWTDTEGTTKIYYDKVGWVELAPSAKSAFEFMKSRGFWMPMRSEVS